MAKICSNCGNKIGFGENLSFDNKLVCRSCYSNFIKERRNSIIQQINNELSPNVDDLDEKIQTKLTRIHKLVAEGILNEDEFEDVKEVLLKKSRVALQKIDLTTYG